MVYWQFHLNPNQILTHSMKVKISMGFVTKWPSRMQGQWFFEVGRSGSSFRSVRSTQNIWTGGCPCPNLPLSKIIWQPLHFISNGTVLSVCHDCLAGVQLLSSVFHNSVLKPMRGIEKWPQRYYQRKRLRLLLALPEQSLAAGGADILAVDGTGS